MNIQEWIEDIENEPLFDDLDIDFCSDPSNFVTMGDYILNYGETEDS